MIVQMVTTMDSDQMCSAARDLTQQGGHWSGKSQGNLIFLQGQGILHIGQGIFRYQESQGKVQSVSLFGLNIFGL